MNNKISYHREGDYFIPNLYIKDYKKSDYCIGKYGHLRFRYLKEHKQFVYTELMLTGKLLEHLASIEQDANRRVANIVSKLAVDEDLKRCNQMEWVQTMNNIKNRAEEIVFSELIYV